MSGHDTSTNLSNADDSERETLVRDIEGLSEVLGRGLYRGLLRDLAKVWNPRDILDIAIQRRVLEHMRSAERGLRRLEAAVEKTGPDALIPMLKSLGLTNLERVDKLETLKRIVLDLERTAQSNS